MENLGSNLSLWINVIAFAVILIIFYFLIKSLIAANKAGENDNKEKQKRFVNRAAILGVLNILFIIFFYFAYGSGKKIPVTPASEEGIYKIVEDALEEKSLDSIKIEAYNKKPKHLQQQDSLKIDTDEYIEKVLKKYEK